MPKLREPPRKQKPPTDDGGNVQHPVHDEDQEDRKPEDYERDIDRSDAPVDEVVR